MLRKVGIVGFLCFLPQGGALQLTCGILWSLGFMLAMAYARPYASAFATTLKMAADAAIISTLVICLCLKTMALQVGHDSRPSRSHAALTLSSPYEAMPYPARARTLLCVPHTISGRGKFS